MYNQAYILTLIKRLIIKILNLKLMIMLEYQNIKCFLKGYVQYWSEEVFVIKKVKKHCSVDMLFVIVNEKKLLELFTKKNCKKQIKKSLELKK